MAYRKPGKAKLGLKALFWGYQGSGKTKAALTFPRIAAIDAESGMAFYEGTEVGKNLVLIDNTQNYDELKDSIQELGEIAKKEDIKTFVEDSTTKFYENIQKAVMGVEEKRARLKGRDVLDTNLTQRSWGKINEIVSDLQNQKIDLSNRGVNVITIAQAKEDLKEVGGKMITIGDKPVMRKNSVYDYDLEVFMFKEINDKGETRYFGKIIKDRTETFKAGEVIENIRYELWQGRLENNGDIRTTSFSKDSAKAASTYEEKVVSEEQSYSDRVTKLMAAWKEAKDVETLNDFKAALAAAKLKGFTGLSPKAEEKLKAILDKFEGK